MPELRRDMFRWAMSFRYLKRMHEAYAVWKDWTRGEREELIRAGGLDLATRILEDLGKTEFAQALKTERDLLVTKVDTEPVIRKRRPRQSCDSDPSKPDTPNARSGVPRWAAAS